MAATTFNPLILDYFQAPINGLLAFVFQDYTTFKTLQPLVNHKIHQVLVTFLKGYTKYLSENIESLQNPIIDFWSKQFRIHLNELSIIGKYMSETLQIIVNDQKTSFFLSFFLKDGQIVNEIIEHYIEKNQSMDNYRFQSEDGTWLCQLRVNQVYITQVKMTSEWKFISRKTYSNENLFQLDLSSHSNIIFPLWNVSFDSPEMVKSDQAIIYVV